MKFVAEARIPFVMTVSSSPAFPLVEPWTSQTPGDKAARGTKLRPLTGSSTICCVSMTWPREPSWVWRTGASVVTTTASAAPTSSVKSIRRRSWIRTSTFARVASRNPWRDTVTV